MFCVCEQPAAVWREVAVAGRIVAMVSFSAVTRPKHAENSVEISSHDDM